MASLLKYSTDINQYLNEKNIKYLGRETNLDYLTLPFIELRDNNVVAITVNRVLVPKNKSSYISNGNQIIMSFKIFDALCEIISKIILTGKSILRARLCNNNVTLCIFEKDGDTHKCIEDTYFPSYKCSTCNIKLEVILSNITDNIELEYDKYYLNSKDKLFFAKNILHMKLGNDNGIIFFDGMCGTLSDIKYTYKI